MTGELHFTIQKATLLFDPHNFIQWPRTTWEVRYYTSTVVQTYLVINYLIHHYLELEGKAATCCITDQLHFLRAGIALSCLCVGDLVCTSIFASSQYKRANLLPLKYAITLKLDDITLRYFLRSVIM